MKYFIHILISIVLFLLFQNCSSVTEWDKTTSLYSIDSVRTLFYLGDSIAHESVQVASQDWIDTSINNHTDYRYGTMSGYRFYIYSNDTIGHIGMARELWFRGKGEVIKHGGSGFRVLGEYDSLYRNNDTMKIYAMRQFFKEHIIERTTVEPADESNISIADFVGVCVYYENIELDLDTLKPHKQYVIQYLTDSRLKLSTEEPDREFINNFLDCQDFEELIAKYKIVHVIYYSLDFRTNEDYRLIPVKFEL